MKGDQISFRVWGRHVVEAAIASSNTEIKEVRVGQTKSPASKSIYDQAESRGISVLSVSSSSLTKWAGTDRHQNVGALVSLQTFASVRQWDKNIDGKRPPKETVIVLDQVEDPQNLGAVLRSADFFGVSAVLITRDRSSPLTGAAAKASAGGIFGVPIIRAPNLARELDELEKLGFWVLGLDANGDERLSGSDLSSERIAMVVGSEGRGLRSLTRKKCRSTVRIQGRSDRDSLNAGASVAIAIYELMRHR